MLINIISNSRPLAIWVAFVNDILFLKPRNFSVQKVGIQGKKWDQFPFSDVVWCNNVILTLIQFCIELYGLVILHLSNFSLAK